MFARGAELSDPAGLLTGTGKRGRHVQHRRPADLAAPALAGLLAAAVAAAPGPDGVALAWETVSETDNAGFNLYRAAGNGTGFAEACQVCAWVKVNAALIPAAAPGSSEGHGYTWVDAEAREPGTTYTYLLEDVDLSGATARHGPVSATVGAPAAGSNPAPNAVRLNAFAATSALPLALPLAGVGLALIALVSFAGIRLRRR